MKYLADIKDIFGTVNPPPAPGNLNTVPAAEGLGLLIVFGIRLVLIASGIAALIFMIWAGFRWVVSEGDPKKLEQARAQMRDAFVGMIIIVVCLSLWQLLTTQILGIFQVGPSGVEFKLPF